MGRNLKLIIALIIVGTITAYIVLVTIPTILAKRSYEAAKTLGEDFSKAFQFTPQITINNTIVLNQQTPIQEFAVLSQNFEHRYRWTNDWLKSKKQIDISGTFEAKAGFNLDKTVSITLTDDRAVVHLPQPSILSVESQGDIVYRDEDGFWNWINPEDRSKATNAFLKDARRFSEQASFVQDAKINVEEKLRKVLTPYAKEVIVVFDNSPSVKMDR
jgi:frataxin-like iron-binding protein CyaY